MSMLTCLHSIFRKIQYSDNGFSWNKVRYVPQEMLKTEGDRSGGYNGKFDEPIVHG